MSDTIIKPAQLHPGDVFLYHGNALLSRLIRAFDGTPYSHASIWTGAAVIEALGDGVNRNTPAQTVAGSEYVHVYRHRGLKGGPSLGSPQLPAAPVTAEADKFGQNKNRYAYEQLLLLAMLAATRRVAAPIPFLGLILRNILDSAGDLLARLASAGKEPLICSELVYRCYAQAGDPYRLQIRGADMAAGMATAMAAEAPASAVDDGGAAEAALTFLENYNALKPMPEGDPAMGAELAVADFVTPGDLSKSPNLQLLGRLVVT